MESRNKEIISHTNEFKIINYSEAAEEESTAAFSHDINENNETIDNRNKKAIFFTKGFSFVTCCFILSLIVYIISRFAPAFAEFWTRYPAQLIRFILAKATGFIPFSLAENVIISLPILTVMYIVTYSISCKRDESDYNFYRWLRMILSLLLLVLTLFLSAFGPAYGRFTLADNLDLTQNEFSSQELYETGILITDLIKSDIGEITYDIDGASVMPYSYQSLTEKINDAFGKYAKDHKYISHFNSNPKPIALSEPMTYTHISGVYTFITGEANINTNYPDFLMPFTMAHEMAHQRGIAREEEANFVAFLVCIGSDDSYIRYSGYANMLNYLNSAISKADKELYNDFVINHLPVKVREEFITYSKFFDKYRDSIASEVSGTVNNSYLQSQGQKEGTNSYGLVVDLAVAYYK